jgi:hypothetical protein
VRLVEQWDRLESRLDPRWKDARLSLRVPSPEARSRAAALLAPAGPGFSGEEIRFTAERAGGPVGPEAVPRMLQRIDTEGIAGTLTLLGAGVSQLEPQVPRPALAAKWEAALAVLPSDWSDLFCELELDSSADIDRAAVLAGPVNPIQTAGTPGFHFRCASRAGYGASPGMVRRCFERLDAEEIGGDLRIERVLCDVHPVGTLGAVFSAGRRPS